MFCKGLESTKELVEKYYKDKKAIRWQGERLHLLGEKLKKIDDEINSPIFRGTLRTELGAVCYDSVSVSGNSCNSPMESNIDAIYRSYEREKEKIVGEIINTKSLITKIEERSKKFDFYISMLSQEAKEFLEFRFGKTMGITQMSLKLNMSKSSVSRKLDLIIHDLYLLDDIYKY